MKNTENKEQFHFVLGKKNYQLIILGLVFIIVGYLLMIGGSSDDPNVWNENIFSPIKLRLSPLLILIGFAIEVFAILYKEKNK